jgi:hypothetical protein
MKKRNLIRTLFFIIIIPIIIYFAIDIFVFKSYKSYPPEILNFNPDKSLIVKTSKPIYYLSENKLYFSSKGNINLNNPIWNGEIYERFYDDKVSVSPNSKYILINHKLGLDVIDSVGNKIYQIKQKSDEIEEKTITNYYSDSDYQWSSDSENLYLKKTKSGSFKDSNRYSLIKLNIKTRKLTEIYNFIEDSWKIYFDKSQKNLYYTAYDKKNDNWIMRKVDLNTKKIIMTLSEDNKSKLITSDTILANLNIERDSGYKNDISIGESLLEKNKSCNIYSNKNGIEKLIFEVKCGNDEFKGRTLGVMEFNSNVFLPNDFFITHIYSKNYEGTIVIDLNSLKYNFYKTEIKPYYASKIETNINLIYNSGELMIR